MSLYLGIDSGTQSAKGLALDLETGRILARASAPHRLIEGLPPGHMEQHPRDWVAAIDAVIQAVASKIDRRRVRGLGISGQQHGLVALDAAGEVIRPAKLWSDISTVDECRILTRNLAPRRKDARLPFLPGYTAPKILWLKRNEPANYRRLRHVLLPHDYLNFHLTGNYFMEAGDASGTALMDIRKRVWARDVIDAIDRNLADWLPSISPSSAAAGALRPALAKRFGFPTEVVVSAGGGDNMMAAIGTGNVVAGIVTASFGTSGTIFAFSRKPVLDPGGEVAGFCSSTGGWLPLICTMNVTLVTEQFRSMFDSDHAGFGRSAAGAPPGAGGLILAPYFDGERTPNLPCATGVLHGLNRRTLNRGHLARAAIEGVTLGMNYGFRRLGQFGIRAKEIRVTGGGAKSAVWRQIMADIFGRPVVMTVENEAAALGAALQSAWCDQLRRGMNTDLANLTGRLVAISERTRCRPDPKRQEIYGEAQARFDRLSRTLFTA